MAKLTKYKDFVDVVARSSGQWNFNGIPIVFNLITFDSYDCFIQLEIETGAEEWNGFEDAKSFCDKFNNLHKDSFPYDADGIYRINNLIESITNDYDAKFDLDEDGIPYGNLY